MRTLTTEERTVGRRSVQAIRRIKQMVKDGHWIRNSVNDGHGNHCMLGLIHWRYQPWMIQEDDDSYGRMPSMLTARLEQLVFQAMDEDVARERMQTWAGSSVERQPDADGVTVGISRGWSAPQSAIATYNNLADDWQEIYDWLERAEQLAIQEV